MNEKDSFYESPKIARMIRDFLYDDPSLQGNIEQINLKNEKNSDYQENWKENNDFFDENEESNDASVCEELSFPTRTKNKNSPKLYAENNDSTNDLHELKLKASSNSNQPDILAQWRLKMKMRQASSGVLLPHAKRADDHHCENNQKRLFLTPIRMEEQPKSLNMCGAEPLIEKVEVALQTDISRSSDTATINCELPQKIETHQKKDTPLIKMVHVGVATEDNFEQKNTKNSIKNSKTKKCLPEENKKIVKSKEKIVQTEEFNWEESKKKKKSNFASTSDGIKVSSRQDLHNSVSGASKKLKKAKKNYENNNSLNLPKPPSPTSELVSESKKKQLNVKHEPRNNYREKQIDHDDSVSWVSSMGSLSVSSFDDSANNEPIETPHNPTRTNAVWDIMNLDYADLKNIFDNEREVQKTSKNDCANAFLDDEVLKYLRQQKQYYLHLLENVCATDHQ